MNFKMMRIIAKLAIGSALLLIAGQGSTADAPAFQYRGIVDRIDRDGGYIIVSDSAQRYSPGVELHRRNGAVSAGVDRLRAGEPVGLVYTSDNDETVIEIWVLDEAPAQPGPVDHQAADSIDLDVTL